MTALSFRATEGSRGISYHLAALLHEIHPRTLSVLVGITR